MKVTNYNTFEFEVVIDSNSGSVETDMMLIRVSKRLYHRLFGGCTHITLEAIKYSKVDVIKLTVDDMKNRINKQFNRWERKALKAKQI